ncbi:hypothetical protein OHR68_35845 [Spirillospora sp. NBC_00431]
MATPYELGKEALDALIVWAEDNSPDLTRNEATTRLHLIDQLLKNVLAWPLEETEAEKSSDGEYLDYALGRPFTRLIVEAKREGLHFSLPTGITSSVQRLSSLIDGDGGKQLKKALLQAARYSASQSVPLAAVSNGNQIVAFLGVRTDGVPPLEGTALVFPSLSSMRENFRLLWDNLSKPGVESRNLFLTLKEGEKPSAPLPLSANVSGYPRYKRRNDTQVGLEILAELFIEDLTRVEELQEEFLKETYASSGALSQYAMLSKHILENRYSLLHEDGADYETEPATTKKGINPNLAGNVLAAGLSKRPIILLGDVGVGKTMFIRRLLHVDAKDVFKESFALYIDFGTRPPSSRDELLRLVHEEIIFQLREKYGIDVFENDFIEAVHHGELNRFDKSPYGRLKSVDEVGYQRERINYLVRLIEDRPTHLRACLEHIRGSLRKQVVFFLDNIDQHPSDVQESVFLIAESLASGWPATVFVSIRPDTFYHSRTEGTLTAYQPRVFTISPPRVDVVLKRRVAFALKQLRDESRVASLPEGVTIDSESLKAYLSVLLENFEENRDLVKLIDNLSAGNIRRALDFVSAFIGSGHVDTEKIIGSYERGARYTIRLHDFLRAIIYGDYQYYEPEASPIVNLFDISQPDGREHFLLALLLCHVEVDGDNVGTEGYVPTDDVYTFGQSLGFAAEQVTWAIERAGRKGLLERAPRAGKTSSREHLRVTSAGVYTARMLAGMFAYLDAMVIDTPIVDDAYRLLIGDAYSLSERLARSEYFRAYLDKQWRSLEPILNAPKFNWREFSARITDDIITVNERLH